MKTRDQVRAERASVAVAAMKPDQIRDYASELRNFAPVVMQSGLGPALALLRGKGGASKLSLYDHLSGWISESVYGEAKGDLLTLVTRNPASKLMRAHEEALNYAAWLRRFAEAREPKARKA